MRALVLPVLILAAAPALAADTEPPKITHESPASAAPGKDVDIEALIEDPSGVFDPVVVYRLGGGEFERLSMTEAGEGVFIATVPASTAPTTTSIEYWIEAYDQEGNGPAQMGSEGALLKITVTDAPPIEPLIVEPNDPKDPKEPGVGEANVREPEQLPPEEGGGAGVWIGVGVGTAVVALAAGGFAGWYFLLREDVPAEVTVRIGAPSPIVGATP